MTPAEAATIIRRWRSRDEDANLAVRAVLDKYGYENLTELHQADPDLLILIHDNLLPLMQMDDDFALEDALVRDGRRDVTGRVVELAPPDLNTATDRPAP